MAKVYTYAIPAQQLEKPPDSKFFRGVVSAVECLALSPAAAADENGLVVAHGLDQEIGLIINQCLVDAHRFFGGDHPPEKLPDRRCLPQ